MTDLIDDFWNILKTDNHVEQAKKAHNFINKLKAVKFKHVMVYWGDDDVPEITTNINAIKDITETHKDYIKKLNQEIFDLKTRNLWQRIFDL